MILRKFSLNLLLTLGVCVANISAVCGDERVTTAGDALAYGLPAFAAGLTLWHKDGEGALEFAESGFLTFALTQA